MRDEILQDLRYAFRMLRRDPGFAAITVLVLAIGIGANTALFTVVNAVLLRQLPFREPDRLMRIWGTRPDAAQYPSSLPDFLDYREENRSFDRLSAFGNWNVNLTGHGETERLIGLRVSADLFQTLGVEAAAGRTLVPDDDRAGAPRVVVLTYGLWQRRFGADPAVVGRDLLLNGEKYTVVGVLPPSFFFFPTRGVELACALSPETDPWRLNRDSVNFLRLVGRLRPGVSQAQAQHDMTELAARLLARYPKSNARKGTLVVAPLADDIVGAYRLALWTLQAAVGVVLLIACANLANLTLARGSVRAREMAIRAALGAGRVRLLRQALLENLLLALLGGALGLLLAHWAVPGLLSLSPAGLPRANEAGLDGRVLGFTLGLAVSSALAFGLFPALAATRINLSQHLQQGGRGSSDGPSSLRLRTGLVVTEVALSLVLLTATGLVLRSFARLQAVEPGFDAANVLTVRVSLPRARYGDPEKITRFYEQMLPRLERLPGVVAASGSSVIPLNGQLATVDFTVVGRPPLAEKDVPAGQFRMIGPGFFHTMRIPVLQGSVFTDRDTALTTHVAVVNETLVRRYFPGQNPLGERLEINDNGGRRTVEIVGVVGDVKHYGLDTKSTYDIYIPWRQVQKSAVVWLASNQYWILRTQGDPMALAAAARREIQAVDSDVAASMVRPMDEYIANSVAPRRFNLQLLAGFAVVALLLAAGGIYGVISYSVARRTHEIGLRMTLGARPADILRLVVAQAMAPAALGVVLGVAGSLAVSRLLAGLLFQVSATDPATYVAVAGVLCGVAVLAAYLPARRATRIDPLAALRS